MWQKVRRPTRLFAASLVVIIAYWNLFDFWKRSVEDIPMRESNDIIVQRTRFADVLVLLHQNGYLEGKVGFATAAELTQGPRTPEDEKNFWQAQYVLFPFLLARRDVNAPYVILDSSRGPIAKLPDGLHEVRDLGNGLVLYRRIPSS